MFQSDRFIMGVCLDLKGTDYFGDNFFDLFPNQPYFVSSDFDQIPEILYCMNSFMEKKQKLKTSG